jgi:hypothetical protein
MRQIALALAVALLLSFSPAHAQLFGRRSACANGQCGVPQYVATQTAPLPATDAEPLPGLSANVSVTGSLAIGTAASQPVSGTLRVQTYAGAPWPHPGPHWNPMPWLNPQPYNPQPYVNPVTVPPLVPPAGYSWVWSGTQWTLQPVAHATASGEITIEATAIEAGPIVERRHLFPRLWNRLHNR